MTYDDYLREHGCTNKTRFITRAEAHRVKKLAAKSGSGHQHVYRCEFCGLWHLGHTNGSTGLRQGRKPKR